MAALETIFLVLLIISCSTAVPTADEYEKNVIFYRFNQSNRERFISSFETSIADQGCDVNGNFTMIVHGWIEGITTPWLNRTIAQFLLHRGGCVFAVDYSKYANVSNYFSLVTHFEGISALITRKLKQIGSYDRQFCFGFSFGSRLCVDAGINIGNRSIARMDLCDPAGPGFDGIMRGRDPKLAAKNVACINTSTDKGTVIYNCHQNFRMGHCGSWQAAAGPKPMGNHGLCPFLYNEAFDHEFVPNNFYKCTSNQMANVSFSEVQMGYSGNFDRESVRGNIFIATAKYPPYVVLNNTIDNKAQVVKV